MSWAFCRSNAGQKSLTSEMPPLNHWAYSSTNLHPWGGNRNSEISKGISENTVQWLKEADFNYSQQNKTSLIEKYSSLFKERTTSFSKGG